MTLYPSLNVHHPFCLGQLLCDLQLIRGAAAPFGGALQLNTILTADFSKCFNESSEEPVAPAITQCDQIFSAL